MFGRQQGQSDRRDGHDTTRLVGGPGLHLGILGSLMHTLAPQFLHQTARSIPSEPFGARKTVHKKPKCRKRCPTEPKVLILLYLGVNIKKRITPLRCFTCTCSGSNHLRCSRAEKSPNTEEADKHNMTGSRWVENKCRFGHRGYCESETRMKNGQICR